MKYRNKYFDKIGYKNSYTGQCICGMKDDKRQKHWKKTRKKYDGWDERCTWGLFLTTTEQVYTWLSMYRASTIVQGFINDQTVKVNCKTLHLSQAIDRVLGDLKFCLTNYDNWDKGKEINRAAENAYSVLSTILPYLWI